MFNRRLEALGVGSARGVDETPECATCRVARLDDAAQHACDENARAVTPVLAMGGLPYVSAPLSNLRVCRNSSLYRDGPCQHDAPERGPCRRRHRGRLSCCR